MGIEHIFNAVEPKSTTMIASQEFKIEYWKSLKENYDPPQDIDLLSTDFSKMYYNALVSTDKDKIISKYDDEKIKELVHKDKLGSNLLLISGDFWGIQKFIFDGLTSSKASKILRSRSAMVQLITYAVVDRIKKEFDGSKALLFGAGKFMILAKNENHHKIEEIQKELDSYFLKNFFGQNGFILSSSTTTKEKILNQKDSMQSDLDALGADNDDKKLNKFDLLNLEDDDILIDPFEKATIHDNNSCKFCNKRIVDEELKEDSCDICFNQINLGKKLTTHSHLNIIQFGRLSREKKIQKNMIEIIKLGNKSYYARFSNSPKHFTWGKTFDISDKKYDKTTDKWSLNSYVPKDKNDKIKDFSILANNSSGLMALKADIDKLGDTFRDLYKEDFRKFNRLSREVEFFFSDYITSLLNAKNIYTVFAGGDDLFVIGEYKEIVLIAKKIRDEFYKFSLNKTTISMGLVMFKPSTPITFVSKMADEAEKRAKIERDSIDIFGVSMKFDEFLEIEDSFKKITDFFEENKLDSTSFYYRLIELCDMKRDINEDIKNAMWQSKLNYIFKRNIYYQIKDKRLREESLIQQKEIHKLIRDYVEKFKPSIFLKIYNNRDNKKEIKNGQI